MTKKEILSAKEGADRIAERRKTEGKKDIDPSADPVYKCENCSSDEFIVNGTSNSSQKSDWFLPCLCGAEEIAATKSNLIETETNASGILDKEHRVNYDDSDDSESKIVDEEELDLEIHCHKCFNKKNNEWKLDSEDDEEVDKESGYNELRCSACDHEIEFGYSHPNRVGRIWPVESSDFNPWMSFPEERFIEDWRRRRWLRPKRKQKG